MIDIKLLRENPEKVKQACENKQAKVDIDLVIELDKKKRVLIQKIENFRAEQKKLGKDQIEQAQELKNKIKELEPELEKTEKEFEEMFLKIPNLPLDDVIVGKDGTENKTLREVGKKNEFKFKVKDYMEIAETLDIIDVKRAAKVSGARFGYLKGDLALMEFGLIQLAMDITRKEGFVPVVPPVMIKPEMMKAMGYVEHGGDEIYYFDKDDLYLTGTSEQSIGPLHADEIFEEKDLPRKYVAFSTCFRREAGSYGKDTKGILRVHQFDKVEMFIFCKPEDSLKEHELILSMEEKLMQELKIPYRVVDICSGDLGDPAAKKYDIEAWMPGQPSSTGLGQGTYRETHSTSNCTDFQARRLNIKYRDKQGKLNLVHTLNGTAFAIGRTLIAIIENYQQKDGSIKIPKVLQKYVGIKKIG
jgi:seryl-tRNA synthetase